MLCGMCGHKLPDDALFCSYCGTKVPAIISEDSVDTKSTHKSRIIGSCVALVLVAVVVMIAYLIIDSFNDSAVTVSEDYLEAMYNTDSDGEAIYEATNIECLYEILAEQGAWDEDELEDMRERMIDNFDCRYRIEQQLEEEPAAKICNISIAMLILTLCGMMSVANT